MEGRRATETRDRDRDRSPKCRAEDAGPLCRTSRASSEPRTTAAVRPSRLLAAAHHLLFYFSCFLLFRGLSVMSARTALSRRRSGRA